MGPRSSPSTGCTPRGPPFMGDVRIGAGVIGARAPIPMRGSPQGHSGGLGCHASHSRRVGMREPVIMLLRNSISTIT